ncbi:unnamed protein product, partial [Amoebophrya sp. A25]
QDAGGTIERWSPGIGKKKRKRLPRDTSGDVCANVDDFYSDMDSPISSKAPLRNRLAPDTVGLTTPKLAPRAQTSPAGRSDIELDLDLSPSKYSFFPEPVSDHPRAMGGGGTGYDLIAAKDMIWFLNRRIPHKHAFGAKFCRYLVRALTLCESPSHAVSQRDFEWLDRWQPPRYLTAR